MDTLERGGDGNMRGAGLLNYGVGAWGDVNIT